MRRTSALIASLALAAGFGLSASAGAEPLRLDVKPRSWLEPGNTVSPYSSVNPASAQGQTVSYLLNPPWQNMRDRFGEGVLPDPVTNGPFVGGQNPFGPLDFGGPTSRF